MEEKNEDVLVDEETREQEETTTEETTEDTVVISKEKFKAMQRKAMAYDATKKTPQPPQKEEITNVLSREEAFLIAKGMDEEGINQLQVIAKGKGISLLDAEKDPMFVAYNEQRIKDKKAEQARLGASKGSGSKENKPDFRTKGLSDDEHKRLWQEVTKS